MRRFVVGTAGHVDHGKTALVRALTGIDTDRLSEEKARGISIELGFATWPLAHDMLATIVDVPGHSRLVRTMIAGAVGMQLVLLVVAADEGVKPQTLEHAAICRLLGIPRALLVLTKVDRVSVDDAERTARRAMDELGADFVCGSALCSARTGEGLERLATQVRELLAGIAAPSGEGHAHLSVDRVLSVRGAGTVVTGTLVRGSVRQGATLRLLGQHAERAVVVRGLQIDRQPVEEAQSPTRLALNLSRLSASEVARGDVITADPDLAATRLLDVTFEALDTASRCAQVTLHAGTRRVRARMRTAGPGLCRIALEKAVAVTGGERFVVRGGDVGGRFGALLGGGYVLDARPGDMKLKGARRALLIALRDRDPYEAVRQLAAELGPRPVAREALRARFVLCEDELSRAADALAARGELVRLGEQAWIRAASFRELIALARCCVAEHHHAAPLEAGLSLETLRARLAARAGDAAASAALEAASAEGQGLRVEAGIASLPEYAERAEQLLEAGRLALQAAALRGATAFHLRSAVQLAGPDIHALGARLVRDGVALKLRDTWFSREHVEACRALLEARLAAGRLSVVGWKTLLGIPRKQAILILEYFDTVGLTRRMDNVRVRAESRPG
jgi:selenocysteine-specific elongation factor